MLLVLLLLYEHVVLVHLIDGLICWQQHWNSFFLFRSHILQESNSTICLLSVSIKLSLQTIELTLHRSLCLLGVRVKQFAELWLCRLLALFCGCDRWYFFNHLFYLAKLVYSVCHYDIFLLKRLGTMVYFIFWFQAFSNRVLEIFELTLSKPI